MFEADPQIKALLDAPISDAAQEFARHLQTEYERTAQHTESLPLEIEEKLLRPALIHARLREALEDLVRWDTERLTVPE